MWFKHRAWIPAAWLASFFNVGAAGFALAVLPPEPWHAGTHVLLAVMFAQGARYLSERKQRREGRSDTSQQIQILGQNESLRQSVEDMQERLRELEERVDFAERILARYRESDRLGSPPS